MQERIKILEMLQEGIINVSEAESLLKAVDEQIKEEKKQEVKTRATTVAKPKFLKIFVDSKEGDKVNVTIPISFLKVAIASGDFMKINSGNIKFGGVDSDLLKNYVDMDLLMSSIENDFVGELVNVVSAEGDIVKIYFE